MRRKKRVHVKGDVAVGGIAIRLRMILSSLLVESDELLLLVPSRKSHLVVLIKF